LEGVGVGSLGFAVGWLVPMALLLLLLLAGNLKVDGSRFGFGGGADGADGADGGVGCVRCLKGDSCSGVYG
jgi:hypothetical protein